MGLFSETVLAQYAKDVVKMSKQDDKIFKEVLDNKFIRELVIELNTEGQMGLGIDSGGNPLFNTVTGRSVYAPTDPLGRGGQPYQVFQSGAYWDSFRVAVGAGFINIVSNPFKRNNNLFEVYTENLEGLTDKNLEELIDEAEELYIQWYKRNLLPR